jgi:hypothetical protein
LNKSAVRTGLFSGLMVRFTVSFLNAYLFESLSQAREMAWLWQQVTACAQSTLHFESMKIKWMPDNE